MQDEVIDNLRILLKAWTSLKVLKLSHMTWCNGYQTGEAAYQLGELDLRECTLDAGSLRWLSGRSGSLHTLAFHSQSIHTPFDHFATLAKQNAPIICDIAHRNRTTLRNINYQTIDPTAYPRLLSLDLSLDSLTIGSIYWSSFALIPQAYVDLFERINPTTLTIMTESRKSPHFLDSSGLVAALTLGHMSNLRSLSVMAAGDSLAVKEACEARGIEYTGEPIIKWEGCRGNYI